MKAYMFANVRKDEEKMRIIDDFDDNFSPLSLFKGLAGEIFFSCDVLMPQKARFPGYEIL